MCAKDEEFRYYKLIDMVQDVPKKGNTHFQSRFAPKEPLL